MKRLILPALLISALIFSGCSAKPAAQEAAAPAQTESKTRTYAAETGPVEVPSAPERVVVLNSSVSGHVMALNVNIVGVDSWSTGNPRFAPYLKDAVEVSEENLEQIIELNPDLIVAASTTKNLDKLSAIAPTVSYTYGKVDYLTQFLEIGKLMNKEAEAQSWIDNFKAQAKASGEKIKAKNGPEATYSVIESFDKQLYVFGDHWARGTEILYLEMGLKMPEKVKEMTSKDGYYALSAEVLPEYAGDYVIFSKNSEADNTFQETETYKNMPAVKNNRLFEADAKEFYFNDPITLAYQLEFFEQKLLGNE